MSGRPGALVVVLGTGTEVGKTWVSCRLAEHLRADGLAVAVRKPVQSCDVTDAVTDADLLAAATGDDPSTVCPPHRTYRVAMAPPMAADALGAPPFTAADLAAELELPAGCDVGLVETAGGVRSPLTDDADNVAFARLLRPDLALLVADAGLGTINAVRLALDALDGLPVLVVLNRYDGGDDLHRRNRAWLAERDGSPVVTGIAELAERLCHRRSRCRLPI
jgi:dethiobiotin synthetase